MNDLIKLLDEKLEYIKPELIDDTIKLNFISKRVFYGKKDLLK
ncbi:hypothetical protein WG909_05240 [Peptostreptococcaceae bacterium AGR-M142]